jgi:hypothetical protein
LKGVAGDIELKNDAYDKLQSNATKYQGPAYPLVGVSGSVEMYVSASLANSSEDPDNCSWYGTVQGGSVTVTTDIDPEFTSSRAGVSDTSMGFKLSSANKLVGLATTVGCASDWATDTVADVFTGTTSSTPIALAKGKTTTISKCTYSVAYSTTIPANLKLDAPGADYVLVGPRMTTTLVID